MAMPIYSAKSSANYSEDIHGLWRANAKERVAYTNDFPSQLLCVTEFTDNSLGKGKATRIEMTFDITDPHAGILTITDNGVGIQKFTDLNRFLKFGSSHSSDKYHQYAWGRFRGMTSMMPEYETARWTATFKLCGNPDSLSQVSQPWSTFEKMGQSIVEIPVTDENYNIGLQMKMHFDMSIFGADHAKQYLSNPQKLFDKTKERLTTKYHQSVFEHTEFVLSVVKDDMNITQSSNTHNWKTLETMLFELSQSSPATCEIVYSNSNPLKWKSVDVVPIEYNLKRDHPELSKAFPTFGVRRLGTGRANIYNDGRLIESRHRYKMEGRKADHNDLNGQIIFLHSYSDCPGGDFKDQPEPCTTKVSIDENCENLKGMYAMFQAEKQRLKEETAREEARKKKEREDERKAKAKEAKAQQAQQPQQAQAGGGAAPELPLPLSPLQNPTPAPSTKQKLVIRKPKHIPETPSPLASPSLPSLIAISHSQSLLPLELSPRDDASTTTTTTTTSTITTSSSPSHELFSSPENQAAFKVKLQEAMEFISPENQAAFKVKFQETFGVSI